MSLRFGGRTYRAGGQRRDLAREGGQEFDMHLMFN